MRAAARLFAGRWGRDGRPSTGRLEAPQVVGGRAELPFDDEALEGRLVWMMGSPRTGTTWLLRMLIHPWILSGKSLTGMRAPLCLGRSELPSVLPVDESNLPHHLTPMKPPGPEPDEQPTPWELLLNSQRADDPAYFFSDAFAPAWRPEVRRLILVRFWSQVEAGRREHGGVDPLVLIKEPNGSHGAESLMSLLPRSRLLFVLRDGRDVVDSMIDAAQAWAPNIRDLALNEQRLIYLRAQSRLWLNFTTAVQQAYEAHPPELRRMVRYEELRREPESTLAPILAWLGLDSRDAHVRDAVETNAFEALPKFMKGPGTPRRAASPGLWRENTTAEEQAAMDGIMGAKLAELGYERAASG